MDTESPGFCDGDFFWWRGHRRRGVRCGAGRGGGVRGVPGGDGRGGDGRGARVFGTGAGAERAGEPGDCDA